MNYLLTTLLLFTGLFVQATPYLSPCDIDAAAEMLYVTASEGKAVLRTDPKTGSVLHTTTFPDELTGLTISPDQTLYVTGGGSEGKVWAVTEGKITRTIQAGHTPMSPVLSPNGKMLYVCNRFDNEVAFIDLKRKKTIARIPMLREPIAADITPDGKTLFVANHNPDGPADVDYVATKIAADGFSLPKDWYLQLANETGKLLRGEIPLTNQVPIEPPSGPLPDLPPPPVPQIIKVEYVSQSVPTNMTAGQTYSVTVSMKNIGNFTWPTGGDFKLGSVDDDPTWGPTRVLLDQDFPSNTVHDFVFNVTAPAAGTYTFQWKMVQEGVTWFGPTSDLLSITVDPAGPAVEKPSGLIDRTDEAGAILTSEHADSPAGSDVSKLFDNDSNSIYLTSNSASWVQHQFADDNQYAVNWYSVTSAPEDPSAQSPNLVVNGSFESGGATPSPWVLGGSGTGSTDTAHDGSSALRITTPDINATSQTIGLDAHTDYAISLWIHAVGVSNGPAVFDTTDVFDGDGEGQFVINASNSGWAKYEGNFNSGVNTSVTLRMFTEGSFSGTIYFDQVIVAAQNADGSERDPMNWTLSGSNDGSSWTTVDARAGIDFSTRSQTLEFDALSNVTAYEYYRFDALNNNGSVLHLAEIELFSPGGPVTGVYETVWTTVSSGDPGTGLLEDFDADGRNNLYEYALGGDPEDELSLGFEPVFTKNGSDFRYVHRLRTDDPELTYTVETTTNLTVGVWVTNGVSTLGTASLGGSYDEVTNGIPAVNGAAYVRLKIGR